MKKILAALCMAGLLCTACFSLNLDGDDEAVDGIDLTLNPLMLSGPDGLMFLSATYDPSPSDVPGCSGVISHTSGKKVWDSLWLSFYFTDTTPVGGELQLERFWFGAALSNNLNNFAHTFTGKMILKERSEKRVVIAMEDVRLSIAHGDYKLNGYLVAKVAK